MQRLIAAAVLVGMAWYAYVEYGTPGGMSKIRSTSVSSSGSAIRTMSNAPKKVTGAALGAASRIGN